MNEDVSLISMHPFFQRFVFSVIQTIREKDFDMSERFVVDADLVPGVSEGVIKASMGEGVIAPANEKSKPVTPVIRRDMSELATPIKVNIHEGMRQSMEIPRPAPVAQVAPKQVVMPKHITPRRTVSRPVRPQRTVAPKPVPIQIPRKAAPAPAVAPVAISEGAIDEVEKYGKIAPLLNDASVSTIECLGEGKELMIIRAGQKQRTRITLNSKEIKEVLDQVADEAHIPLIEGVFRASVKGFSINAVVSEMVSSRFVIKKATAYGMLE